MLFSEAVILLFFVLFFSLLPASPSLSPLIQVPDIGEYEDHDDQDGRCDNDQEQKRGNVQIHCSVRAAVENSLEEILDPINETE